VYHSENINSLGGRKPSIAKPDGPVLATLNLTHPIPTASAPISAVELRDIAAGAAAQRAAAQRGDELLDQTIAALVAMSNLTLDNVEDADLGDLGRVLAAVSSMLILSA
jgi:hypothetical protein